MKLKKLYLSTICYLTLIAFIGAISIQISSYSKIQLQKQEVSANGVGLNSNLNLVFEEERDADDFLNNHFLTHPFLSSSTVSAFYFQNFLLTRFTKYHLISGKRALFIFNRVLRL